MQTRKLTVVREDRYAEPVTSGEKVGKGQGGGVEKDSPISAGWPKVSGLSQSQQRTESPSRRLGSFSQLPNLAGRGVGQGYSQVGDAGHNRRYTQYLLCFRCLQLALDNDALWGYNV